MNKGWIAVDLDGTLAEWYPSQSPDTIGDPVPAMLNRVKKWLAEGKDVRLFTARAGNEKQTELCKLWLKKHRISMPVTNKKDHMVKEIWDDRAVQIVRNTGERVDGKK